ncbi:unnamed protein product [Candidula unifasciata]|uniref:BZIP domain-containing protein n=1 Tax=Candidula unifasciata TaxID=100452 RepID=A0A8S3YWA3_9EUPU|nr:unnamed protein product [Candidula unifasciata]
MEDKQEKRRTQNVKAAQRSYEAKKQERELLQMKHSELQDAQMQLLHDKCRLEEQIKLLEYVVKSMDHIQKCALSKSSVASETILQPICERSTTENDYREDNDDSCGGASQTVDLSSSNHFPSAVPIVLSGTDNPKLSSKHLQKRKKVTFATTVPSTCDEHILDPTSYLAVGATQDVYLESPHWQADIMDAVVTSSSSEEKVFAPSAKKIKLSKASVIQPPRGVLVM